MSESTPRGELANPLFELDPNIRYVAVQQGGTILEMKQSPRWPTGNPHDTDRAEELFVNPVILQLAVTRGNLDMGGARYVVIRYGSLYQALFPYGQGHVSVGISLQADPVELAKKIAERLATR